MVANERPTITRDRRRLVERIMRAENIATTTDISDGAKLVYAVSCLICDPVGRVKKADLDKAMQTPHITGIAVQILMRCGLTPGSAVN